MPILAKTKSGSSERKLVPEGQHVAVCDLVCDLGLQEGFEGSDPKHQVYIRWQLPNERMRWEKDGIEAEGPMVIGRFLTLSTHPKSTMRPMLEEWLGRGISPDEEKNGFDLAELAGLPASLFIKHKKKADGTIQDRIIDVSPCSADPQVEGEHLPLAHEYGDPATYGLLPEWLRKKVDEAIDPDEIPI